MGNVSGARMSSLASTPVAGDASPQEAPRPRRAQAAPAKKSKARPYLILGRRRRRGPRRLRHVHLAVARQGEHRRRAGRRRRRRRVHARERDRVKVHVTDNQQVTKGDLLVEIDPADYAAKEKQAEAELAAARAQAAGRRRAGGHRRGDVQGRPLGWRGRSSRDRRPRWRARTRDIAAAQAALARAQAAGQPG